MFPIRVKTVQESDLRMLGSLARNIQRVLPVTQADIDAAAALGKGWVVWKVFEVSDPLDNLRGGTQLIIRQNSIQPGQNVRRVIFVAGPGGQAVVIRGTDYIALPDAIANSLQYVKAFGGTEQNGTPTPDTPVDIVSNNGVLKYGVLSTNLLDLANCTDGYYYNPSGEYTTAASARLSNYIPVKAGVTYTVGLAGVQGSSNVRLNLFDTAKNWLSQTMFVAYANTEHAQTITPAQDGFFAFSANYTSNSYVDWNTAQVVQGSYTVETMPEYEPYREGIYTDGTVETIEDTLGNTATTEMLLKVGDYQDVQSILDGVVTRNVGVKVLNGTEEWQKGQSFYVDNFFDYAKSPEIVPYCTHYKGIRADTTATEYLNTNSIRLYNMPTSYRLNIFAVMSDYADVNAFKQYLADQYAAGTPVIIVYPLATSTTESVAGQTLQVTDGDNTLEITQASLSGLELEAEYTKVA